LQPGEALKTRTVGQLSKTPSRTVASCLPGRNRLRLRQEREYGSSPALSQARKNTETAQLGASPIPKTASCKRLVNSARFDKARSVTADDMSSKYYGEFFEAGRQVATSSPGFAANPTVRFQHFASCLGRQSCEYRKSSGRLANWAFRSPEIVRCTKTYDDSPGNFELGNFELGNFEFRAFPQCFLNLLETPAP
jgi:hypothetical protein